MVKAIDTGEAPQPMAGLICAKIKIKEIKQMIIMWPATILANNLIINAKGLIKTLKNSTNTSIGFTKPGTPGGLKICPQ